jgi:hypothetical protein
MNKFINPNDPNDWILIGVIGLAWLGLAYLISELSRVFMRLHVAPWICILLAFLGLLAAFMWIGYHTDPETLQ